MHQQQLTLLIFFLCLFLNTISVESITYYATKVLPSNSKSLLGQIFIYNPNASTLLFLSNYSFHIDDSATYLYDFEPGPVTVNNQSSTLIYIPIQCGTAFQRLLLLSFDIKTMIYKQSRWILHDGVFAYLFYDPHRQRLFGLRDVSTFTLIMEEYDTKTLDVIRKYTQQDGIQYSFPFRGCSIFDYEENWIVEVRTQYENLTINAYFIKMDLNLVGKKDDIVVDYHLMPNVHNLCTMTYDIKTKVIFATWQHGSIDRDLVMLYMDPYTSKFSNETLLLRTPQDWEVEDIEAVFNEQTRQILFMIHQEQDVSFQNKYWIMWVEFDTMEIIQRKQVSAKLALDSWEIFAIQ